MAYQNGKNTEECVYALERSIKAGKDYACYLLFGEEVYLKKQNERKLVSHLIDPSNTMNYTTYQGSEADATKIIDMAETMPFFANRRVILVKNSGFFKNASEEMAQYLLQQSQSTVLIFVETEVDKRNKLYKIVEKSGLSIEYVRQKDKILFAWINSRMKSVDKMMADSVKSMLLTLTGENMEIIDKELEKLISYAWDRSEITAIDLKAVCANQIEDQIFAMVRAISEKKQKTALQLYYDLRALKVAPIKILSLINRQYGQILHLLDSKKRGERDSEMAKKWGMNEFVVRNILSQSRGYGIKEIQNSLFSGIQAEEDIKTGRLTEQLALEMLIMKLSSEKE